jgi:hypothetical protein
MSLLLQALIANGTPTTYTVNILYRRTFSWAVEDLEEAIATIGEEQKQPEPRNPEHKTILPQLSF